MENFLTVNSDNIKHNLVNLRQLVFEVTDRCNLKCKYCAFGDLYEGYDRRNNSNFSIDNAKLVVNYLVEIWKSAGHGILKQPLSIGFYGGEPLLNMKFIKEIISYIESINGLNKVIYYTMTTNAMLLNRYMDYLVEKSFKLLISIDGNELNQSYRCDITNGNSFSRVFKNINLLKTNYPEYFTKKVGFNTVLHNKNTIPEIHSFFKDNFSKIPSISAMSNFNVRKDKYNEFKYMYQGLSNAFLKEPKEYENKFLLESPRVKRLLYFLHGYSGNMYYDYNDFFAVENHSGVFPTGTCLPFFKKMYITVTGKILQCEHISHKYALGKIENNEVVLDFENIANRYNYYTHRFIEQCKTCFFRHHCNQCVFQIDNIDNQFAKCNGYRSINEKDNVINEYVKCLRDSPEIYGKLLKNVIINY